MNSVKDKLTGLIILATLNGFSPCFADSADEGFDTQPEVPTFAWADTRPATSVAASCQSSAAISRTSRRSNTNLSRSLPATVSCSMKLSVLDDRDYTATAAEPQIELNIIRENAVPVSTQRHGMRGPRYSEGF